MKKDIIVAVVAVAILVVVGYLYWTKWRVETPTPTAQEQALQNVNNATDAVIKSSTQGALPSLATPDTNPVTKTNPFSNIKTNPFQ